MANDKKTIHTKGWKMGEYPMQLPKPRTPEEALTEIETFNHKLSAKILRKALKDLQTENADLLEQLNPDKPEPKPRNNTDTYLKFTIDKDGEEDVLPEYFALPHDEAHNFVSMYHGFDDWCGLGIKAYVRIIEPEDIPPEDREHTEYFHNTYEAAGDLFFEERNS